MTTQATINWPQLYEQDEVAWLDAMASYAATGQADKLDLVSLQDYLQSGAERERREVKFKLKEFIFHHLRWAAQPELRTRERLSQMRAAKRELREYLQIPTLAQYAQENLVEISNWAIEDLVICLPKRKVDFPAMASYTVADWMGLPLPNINQNDEELTGSSST